MRLTLRLAAGTLFVFAACSIAFITITFQAITTKAITTSNLTNVINASAHHLKQELVHADELYHSTVELLAVKASNTTSEDEIINLLRATLDKNQALSSAHAKTGDLDVHIVAIRLNRALQDYFNADQKHDYAALIHQKGNAETIVRLYGEGNQDYSESTTSIELPGTNELLKGPTSPTNTGIYITPSRISFMETNVMTYAMGVGDSIVAIDLPLSTFSKSLTPQSLGLKSDSGLNVYLHDKAGQITIASQSPTVMSETNSIRDGVGLVFQKNEGKTVLKVSNQYDWMPIDYTVGGIPKGYAVELLKIIGDKSNIEWHFVTDNWARLRDKFKNGELDALHSLRKSDALAGTYSQAMFDLPFGIATMTGETYNLKEARGKLGIVSGWTIIPELSQFSKSTIIEYPTLEAVLKALENGEINAAIDSKLILDSAKVQFEASFQVHTDTRFSPNVDTAFHILLASEHSHLAANINAAIRGISSETHQQLSDYWTSNRERVSVPEAALSLESNVIHRQEGFYIYKVPMERQGLYLTFVVPEDAVEYQANTVTLVLILFTVIFIVLMLPFIWHLSRPIVRPILKIAEQSKKIQRHEYSDVARVPSNIIEIDELSHVISETATSLIEHEKRHQDFLDAVIKMIAQAIDDKSSHTGGHCNRVPDIAMSFIENLNDDNTSYADFYMNKQQLREYYVAAWLHDCGKLTVPEHIIDKGSKLEALYNRIHEIRTRFEVILRDEKIRLLESQSGGLSAENEEKFHDAFEQLTRDFEAVASANVGNEFFDDDKKQNVIRIAEKTFTRHFDDRLGLSPSEENDLKMSKIEPSPLPARENLLSDKQEHIRNRVKETLPESFGITMKAPEREINLGEVYNLSIRRGTLTEEDRYAIQEHMVSTIKMLNSLPFPPELENVPRYASTHHEKIDGTGYPRGYDYSQLSLPERVLMISDIFEALTAMDRPYKQAKSLEEAKTIIGYMAKDNHLDADLVEYFFNSGVPEHYLQRQRTMNKPA